MSAKNIGHHLEVGLRAIGDALVQRARDKKQWDDESRSLGLISTTDKLRWLEAEAYRKTRVDKDVTQELNLLNYLRQARKFEIEEDAIIGEARFVFASQVLSFVVFTLTFHFFVYSPTNKACFQQNLNSEYCKVVKDKTEFFTGKHQ